MEKTMMMIMTTTMTKKFRLEKKLTLKG